MRLWLARLRTHRVNGVHSFLLLAFVIVSRYLLILVLMCGKFFGTSVLICSRSIMNFLVQGELQNLHALLSLKFLHQRDIILKHETKLTKSHTHFTNPTILKHPPSRYQKHTIPLFYKHTIKFKQDTNIQPQNSKRSMKVERLYERDFISSRERPLTVAEPNC